jgi:hypothetical protein
MNISNLLNFSAFSNWTTSKSSTESVQALSPLALAVQRADKRVQTEVDTNTAQLSSFGKLQSAVSDVQIAAHTLTTLTAKAPSSDVQHAVTTLMSAFNAATNTARTTAALPGATAASHSANRVGKDLQGAMSPDAATSDALKTIGVNLQDGSLALDAQKFDAAFSADPAAVQATLRKVGQLLDKAASTELEVNGNVSGSLNTLNLHAKVLEAQQAALQSAAQATSPAQVRANTAARGYGLAAYQANMNKD